MPLSARVNLDIDGLRHFPHSVKSFRRFLLGLAIFLFLSGAIALAGDFYCITTYGVDFNDIAFISADNEAAEWPTGLRPAYADFPLGLYALTLMVLSLFRGHSGQIATLCAERTLRGTV